MDETRDPVGRVLLGFFLAIVAVLVVVLAFGRGLSDGPSPEVGTGGAAEPVGPRAGPRLCALLDVDVPTLDDVVDGDGDLATALRDRAGSMRDALGDSDELVENAVRDAAFALEGLADATDADPTGAQAEALVRALADDAAYRAGQSLLDEALAGCG